MASKQVLTLAVRRYVIAGDRPFQDVMDAIYACRAETTHPTVPLGVL